MRGTAAIGAVAAAIAGVAVVAVSKVYERIVGTSRAVAAPAGRRRRRWQGLAAVGTTAVGTARKRHFGHVEMAELEVRRERPSAH